MDLWIYIIVFIVYGIAYVITGGRIGRRRYRRYDPLNALSIIDDYDPLAEIRYAYEERLKIYYANNKPKNYLINKNCEARLVKEANGKLYFYCKERAIRKSAGRYFEVKGDNTHVSTMWAIVDMEFNALTRYQDIKKLYYTLNQGIETTGGLRYYREPFINKLPKPEVNKCAQNEFCRMEIVILPNGDKVLICSEIWGGIDFEKPRRFMIKADKLVLYAILSEFIKKKDKMSDYIQLLSKYAQRTDCEVREILAQAKAENKSGQISENKDIPNEPEEIKYIHVDIQETPLEASKRMQKKQTKIPDDNAEMLQEELFSENDIKKNDERKLDI